MAPAIFEPLGTRRSWSSSQVNSSSTRGLVRCWRTAWRCGAGWPRILSSMAYSWAMRANAWTAIGASAFGDVIELASEVGPAIGQGHGAARAGRIGQRVVAAIAVDLQDPAGEASQVAQACSPPRPGA